MRTIEEIGNEFRKSLEQEKSYWEEIRNSSNPSTNSASVYGHADSMISKIEFRLENFDEELEKYIEFEVAKFINQIISFVKNRKYHGQYGNYTFFPDTFYGPIGFSKDDPRLINFINEAVRRQGMFTSEEIHTLISDILNELGYENINEEKKTSQK